MAVLITIRETKAERKHDQKIDVTARNHLVDRELHVKGGGEGQQLQEDRQHQDLNERMPAAAQLAQESRER